MKTSRPSGGHDIIDEHVRPPSLVERVTESVLPTRHGTFRIVGYRATDGTELVTLSQGIGEEQPRSDAPLVRLHSECLTGDALGSRRCDCGEQLEAGLARIAAEGEGVLVYIRGHEGRGIGLIEKLRAYRLQDEGADTVDANLRLGHPADARDYRHAADILRDLGIDRIRLISSNPAKEQAMTRLGVTVVKRLGASVPPRPENEHYLRTKFERMCHDGPGDVDRGEGLLTGSQGAEASVDRPGSPPHQRKEDADLVERYGWLASHDEWVVAQSAQSMDGFLATRTGDGAGLSGDADHRHLHRLRALSDAVIVGAQTVVNDDPLLTVRLVAGSSPARVVLDPHGRVPLDARVLAGPEAMTLWLTGPDAPSATASHVCQIRLGAGHWEPREVLGALRECGLRRVLVEGGGRTVSTFVVAGALDRLYLTIAPILLGGGVPGVRVPAVERIADADRWPSRRFMLGDDTCTELVFR